ncbi:helicase-associated domain-containing protein [Georgenia halophila]|uniref:Helicase-associated domain-containing protein n=1 Tax=Georgenia halophila TaxID=620889 RepID=A0ABP8KS99_9MICO
MELVAALNERDDATLAALLAARPDLASPTPSSLTSLAARAGSRLSVDRALAGLGTVELAVAEAVVALAPLEEITAARLSSAVGLDAGPSLEHLADLALVVDGTPVAPLAEALGPHPVGLGPTLAELDETAQGSTHAVTEPSPPSAPTTPEELRAVLIDAPESAVGTLDALTWGPPVGTIGSNGMPEGAGWLLEHGLLRHVTPTQLVLPREVALAAREGRTHREPPRPPELDYRTVPAHVIDAEAARAAEEIVRLVRVLLETWQDEGARVLRTGGVGVRELRRTAAALDVTEQRAALVAELTAMAGLLSQDGDEQLTWVPARTAEDWLADPLHLQWAQLVLAWVDSARTPWLVGTREGGNLRSTLEPTLERSWAVELRRRVLRALKEMPEGAALDADQVHALLSWERPRATAPETTVASVLIETDVLGLTGAGALTEAARRLLDRGSEESIGEALRSTLPEPVSELLVQGDLTAVVPGRPDPDLGALLEHCTDVESRGSGLTVRFTAASVRRALDTGIASEELLERLKGYSRTPLPQALEYLVRDAARRHGQVKVGAANSYLRVEDAAIGAELMANPSLTGLRLRALSPTVLASAAPPGEVLKSLRNAGLAPVPEGPGGAAMTSGAPAAAAWPGTAAGPGRAMSGFSSRRRPLGAPTDPGAAASTYTRRPDAEELQRVVARMRAGEEQVHRDVERRSAGGPVATDPVHALEVLRDSAAAGESVDIVVVGALGTPEQRRVRPLSVEGGRVRMADLERETEMTVAIHRISAVATVSTT